MGCCGGREKEWDVKPAQKWDYINLSDFKSSGCFTPFTYGFLWIMLGVSLACYIADFSTMINLLLWNKFGANGITPPAPFGIEAIPRWVFTGCIILSYILLVYRWWKAVRAMKSGGVAKSYLDPLAARIQSVRMGKEGRGFRRFLVFAELTKSKHGTEYIALFVYFAFEAWLRIIFAEGPRNVINAYTIYHLITTWADVDKSPDTNKHDSGIQKFWAAALAQANNNHIQAAVFLGMVFTIVVWVIAFIGLVIAFIMYVIFLWHHIPQQDGGLRGYCKRKVDKSVEKIVGAKIKQALEDEQKKQKKSHKNKGPLPEPQDLKRQPTLPVFMDAEGGELPPYATRPGTPSSALDKAPTLPDVGNNFSRPGMPRRNGTGMSGGSYGSDAPLLGNAADVGFGEPGRPYSPGPGRPYSPANGRSASPAPPPRPFTPTGELVMDRAGSPGPGGRTFTPANGAMPPFAPGGRPGPPNRANTGFSNASSGGRSSPGPGQMRTLTPANGSMGPRPTPPPGTPGPGGLNPMARTGSAQSAPTYRGPGTPMQPPPRSNTSGPGGMMPPPRSNTAGPNGMQPPPRSNTAGPNGMQPPPRSNTAGPYAMQPPPRSNTAGPYAMQQGRQSPASFSRPNPYGQRTSGQSNGAIQEYEMQPQARGGPPSAAGSDAYQAYRPGGGAPTPAPQMGRPSQQPPQGGHPGSYAGDSIFDQYT